MKKIFIPLILLFTLLTENPASAQSEETRFLIDTCITILKKKSVHAKSVDWDTIRKNALIKAKGINDVNKIGPVMRYIYSSINDFHGAFFYRDSTFKIPHKNKPVSDSIMNEWKKGVKIETAILENKIGYLRIPYMPTGSREENNKKTQSLNDSLCSILEKNITGIIIDLRLNGGGDMHLMILGVQQLLGAGHMGSFLTGTKEDWILKDNAFYADTTEIVSIVPECTVDAQTMPVVLLTSTATGSSGEFFIMAFKGRKKTILLGAETAGYVTVVEGLPINNDAYMYVSVGYAADRTGKVYKKAIKPDIVLTSTDKFNDINNDKKTIAAISWIKQQLLKK